MYNQHNLQSRAIYIYNYSKIVLVDKSPELLKYLALMKETQCSKKAIWNSMIQKLTLLEWFNKWTLIHHSNFICIIPAMKIIIIAKIISE